MRLENKTALITGGNSGIGLATARLFVAEGAQVAILGRDSITLAAAVEELGSQALGIVADVNDYDAVEQAVAQAVAKFGPLDIIFANAGVGDITPLGTSQSAQFDKVLKTNVTGAFMTVQATLLHLRDGASVIMNGSVHANLGVPGFAAYAASKAGVRAMVRVLASELSPRGIRVNLVVPGPTRTPIWEPMAPTAQAMQALEGRLSQAMPLGRMCEPEEIAQAVLYLASDESKNVQAAELVIDGGQTGAPSGAPVFRR